MTFGKCVWDGCTRHAEKPEPDPFTLGTEEGEKSAKRGVSSISNSGVGEQDARLVEQKQGRHRKDPGRQPPGVCEIFFQGHPAGLYRGLRPHQKSRDSSRQLLDRNVLKPSLLHALRKLFGSSYRFIVKQEGTANETFSQ